MRPAALEKYGSSRYRYDECHMFTGPGSFYKGNLHCHSTLSDGNLCVEDLVRLYRDNGYHFLSASEHETFYRHEKGSGFDDFLLLPSVEWSSNFFDADDLMLAHHIHGIPGPARMCAASPKQLANGQTLPAHPYKGAKTARRMVRELGEYGCIPIYNHPNWSHISPQELAEVQAVSFLEIFNYASEIQNASGISLCHWDALLSRGQAVNGIAGDDNHNEPDLFDSFGGWISVFAAQLTPDAILEALLAGCYYSSSGPRIYSYGIAGGRVYVECSPAAKVRFITGGVIGGGDIVLAPVGKTLEQASMVLDGREKYVRIECTDADGNTAWSNPLYSKEFSLERG